MQLEFLLMKMISMKLKNCWFTIKKMKAEKCSLYS
jgi:hypothetical protein